MASRKIIQVIYTVNDAALLKSKGTILANEAAAKSADEAVKKFGKSGEAAGNQASKSFMNLGNVWRSLVAIGITAFFVNLGKKVIDLGIKQEQLNIAFTTFLGSAEKAKKLLGELNKFAIITPFTPDQVNKAAQALLAFGVQGKDIIPTLKMLGDVSSGTGKDLTEMAIIFGQIRSTGRLMGQDLLQLINAGFNPLQVISEKTGKSVKILKEEMEKGLISFDMVSDAFKTATSEGGLFFNLMEAQSRSIGGVLSTIEGNFDEFLKNLFAAESGPMKRFVDLLERFSRGLMQLSLTEDQLIEKGNQMTRDAFTAKFNEFAKSFATIEEAARVMNEEIDVSIALLSQERKEGIKAEQFDKDADAELLKRIETKKQHKLAIQDVMEARKEEAKVAETKNLGKRLEDEAKAAKELDKRLKELEKTLKGIAEPDAVVPMAEGLIFPFMDQLEGLGDELMAQIETNINAQANAENEADRNKIKREKETADTIKGIRQQAFDWGITLLQQFVAAQLRAGDETFQADKDNFDARLLMAGNNERRRSEILLEREKFDQEQAGKKEMFEKEQAKKEQDRQVKLMIIQGSLNALKALGTPPVPNLVAAGLTQAANLIMIAQAKSIGFKEGVINLQGPGNGKSDSINARLSKGESVITAEATSRSMNLLQAVQDRRIDDRILSKLAVTSSGVVSQIDNSDVVNELKRHRPDYYEQGYFTYKIIEKGKTLKQHIKGKYF